ncbi:MAG TPA: complex I NDUFA9 subunit family protein [Hyphomicrobiaceae bacterium]|nr:complex I NDUFA9 subunit family protein [Hyphomicrobiaceae bacterium]
MAESGNGKLVTIFGGSGFVGRYAVRALARRGWRVRAAVRRPDLAGHLQPMGGVGQIHAVQANLRYPESLARAVEGADAVVNLVAILSKSGKQTFDAVNTAGARTVAKAVREARCKSLVHVSAIGAARNAASNYARSKGAGEQAVLEEYPGAVILRPSLIFGPEDDFFPRFAAMARMAPMLPLIGPKARFQPVFVGDVAEAIANTVEGKAAPGAVYELGGPEVLTMRELLDRTQEWSGRNRPYLRLPFWLAKLGAALTAPLPNAMRPLTVDQVRLLQSDTIVSDAATADRRTLQGLGVAMPTAMSTVVPLYLEQFRPKGQFSHYRG